MDLAEVFDIISKAQQAILFLVFQPGSPSIIDAVANALKAKPTLFVRGAARLLKRQANSTPPLMAVVRTENQLSAAKEIRRYPKTIA